MGTASSSHDCSHPEPVRSDLQHAVARPRLHGSQHSVLLPAPRLLPRALQGSSVLHWPGDLHRHVPLLPHLHSFNAAYTPCENINGTINYNKCDPAKFGYTPTGIPFNDAYRYVDWFLTVPLLLIEIVLVMRLSDEETFSRCCTLGVSSALMIANGYPGETTGGPSTRWCFWFLSMLPFPYIVYTLFVGLKESQEAQPEACKDQVKW